MQQTPVTKATDHDIWKVKTLNSLHGNLTGKPCPNCLDKGFTVYLRGGYIVAEECRCLAGRRRGSSKESEDKCDGNG